MVEEVKDTIFVGGIPYDMTLEEFEEEVAIWGKEHTLQRIIDYSIYSFKTRVQWWKQSWPKKCTKGDVRGSPRLI